MSSKKRTIQTNLNSFLKFKRIERSAVSEPERSVSKNEETNRAEVIESPCNENMCSYDIGKFINKSEIFKDDLVFKALVETWNPPEAYVFPSSSETSHTRNFQRKWLTDFPWLAYSDIEQGAFCKVCVLFSSNEAGKGNQVLGALKTKALTRYKNALDDFRKHSERDYHKLALLKAENFRKCFLGKQDTISLQIDSYKKKVYEENKLKLVSIAKTIIFCGRQNIALRGHRDDITPRQLLCGNNNENEGNFKALLKFRVDAGDKVLENHLLTASKTATGISKTTQNELISICGKIISDKIIEKVKESVFFSILCDETTDISHKEQMSICIRYIDKEKSVVCENFIKFVSVVDLTGESLGDTIMSSIYGLELSMDNLRGQGYDGGANMSGKFRGVQALILKQQPKAIYTHCVAHRLNLALLKSCSVQAIRNLCGTIGEICNFVRDSNKRVELFKQKISTALPESRSHILLKLCETRWVEKHEAVLRFSEMLIPTIDFLEDIIQQSQGTILATSNGLLHSILNFEFILALEVAVSIFSITLPLSRQLQDPSVDLPKCFTIIKTLFESLKAIREGSEFNVMFQKAVQRCQDLDIEVKIPRLANRQTQRNNVKTDDPEKYFRISVFLPVVDHFMSELSTRFLDKQSTSIKLQYLIPSFLCASESDLASEIMEAASFYESDLPGGLVDLTGELTMWKNLWRNPDASKSAIPSTAMEAYLEASGGYFPNIRQLLHILAILPITTSTAERSFSTLRRLKTYLRSTMGNDRLNGIALMNIHRNIPVDAIEVVEKYATSNRRRLFEKL